MRQIIDDTLAAIRLNYEMNSPSEVAARLIGEPIVEGIIEGMLRTAPEFLKILDTLSLAEHKRMQGLQQTFAPVPDRGGFVPDPGARGNTRNYNLNVNSVGADSQGIIRDFATMEALS